MNKKKSICIAVMLTVLLLGSLYILQRLVMPKYMSEIPEGALIAEYYKEEVKNHDVLFIGDCEVYENVSPITLWEDYGISSYIRGSAQQLIWQTYYLLEDTLRYETPDVFVFNVLSMKYDEPQNEAYNRMSIDGMRLSMSKIRCAQASMTEEEELLTYLFPLLRYHTRWSEITGEDFRYLFHRDIVSHNGYLMQKEIRPLEVRPRGKKLPNYQFSEICYEYLDKMEALCRENGVQMVLMKAPSVYPYWYDEWDVQMQEYAEEHDLIYINYLNCYEEIGIDFSTDTYDAGLHLNVYGAEKLSKHLGKVLAEQCGVSDHREDAAYKEIWDEKVARYYQERNE